MTIRRGCCRTPPRVTSAHGDGEIGARFQKAAAMSSTSVEESLH
ncbi:hypothetical protein [Streptomyces sp. NPDC056670]